jgi:transposase
MCYSTTVYDTLAVAARRPNIKEAPSFASLLRALPEILEDGDNELPDLYRPTLHRMHSRLLELREDIEAMTKEVDGLVKRHPVCSRLTAIEGITTQVARPTSSASARTSATADCGRS